MKALNHFTDYMLALVSILTHVFAHRILPLFITGDMLTMSQELSYIVSISSGGTVIIKFVAVICKKSKPRITTRLTQLKHKNAEKSLPITKKIAIKVGIVFCKACLFLTPLG